MGARYTIWKVEADRRASGALRDSPHSLDYDEDNLPAAARRALKAVSEGARGVRIRKAYRYGAYLELNAGERATLIRMIDADLPSCEAEQAEWLRELRDCAEAAPTETADERRHGGEYMGEREMPSEIRAELEKWSHDIYWLRNWICTMNAEYKGKTDLRRCCLKLVEIIAEISATEPGAVVSRDEFLGRLQSEAHRAALPQALAFLSERDQFWTAIIDPVDDGSWRIRDMAFFAAKPKSSLLTRLRERLRSAMRPKDAARPGKGDRGLCSG